MKLISEVLRAIGGWIYGCFWTLLFGSIFGCEQAECGWCSRFRRKVLVYDHRDWCFRRALAKLHDGEGRIYLSYVREDDGIFRSYVNTRERDITWCYGWTGMNVDALKATVTMAASDDRPA